MPPRGPLGAGVIVTRTLTLTASLAAGIGGFLLFLQFGAADGLDAMDIVRSALIFASTFWLAWGATTALAGLTTRPPKVPRDMGPLTGKTAILVPVYNEDPVATFARIAAMDASLKATGLAGHFHFAILSDTRDEAIATRERHWFLRLLADTDGQGRIFYRRRSSNRGRKAGNIEDFIKRSGAAYEFSIILDADSLIEGETLVEMVRRMQAAPDLGLLQTLPGILHARSRFGRAMQFAATFYSPIFARGLAMMQGRTGPFWGHNAIVRTRAFAESCGLPELQGKPPFGGHVLSHDYVEAALLARAGWQVRVDDDIAGSYEEGPENIVDHAKRDRRWCQGNLQHSRVIGAKGLHWATRQHLATGIMSYVSSPLWLIQLLVGLALALQAAFIRPEYFTNQFTLFPAWPVFDSERALNLFIFTMAILLAPKVFGWFATLVDGPARRGCGGAIMLTVSAVLEILLSALIAPVMMLIQSSSVFSIISGRDTGWKTQRRDDGSIPFRAIVQRHWRHTALGIVAAIAAFSISPYIFAWMSPTIVGLWLAIPTSWASASAGFGWALRRMRLLLIPEESAPPPIAERAWKLGQEFEALDLENHKALDLIHGDIAFRDLHQQIIQIPAPRVRGKIDTDRVIAEAKLTDAQSIEDARVWLSGRETMLVLHDRALIALLAALPEASEPRVT